MRIAQWLFDQSPSTAALTTRQVLEKDAGILVVIHYEEDHSWAFLCGNTDSDEDGRVIGMGTALRLDPTLMQVADLLPGWVAERKRVGGVWHRRSFP